MNIDFQQFSRGWHPPNPPHGSRRPPPWHIPRTTYGAARFQSFDCWDPNLAPLALVRKYRRGGKKLGDSPPLTKRSGSATDFMPVYLRTRALPQLAYYQFEPWRTFFVTDIYGLRGTVWLLRTIFTFVTLKWPCMTFMGQLKVRIQQKIWPWMTFKKSF